MFCLCVVVPLKHGLNYEILEKGHVRFWLQAVKLSPAVSYRFIVNDKEVTSGEVTSSTFILTQSQNGNVIILSLATLFTYT